MFAVVGIAVRDIARSILAEGVVCWIGVLEEGHPARFRT